MAHLNYLRREGIGKKVRLYPLLHPIGDNVPTQKPFELIANFWLFISLKMSITKPEVLVWSPSISHSCCPLSPMFCLLEIGKKTTDISPLYYSAANNTTVTAWYIASEKRTTASLQSCGPSDDVTNKNVIARPLQVRLSVFSFTILEDPYLTQQTP